MVNNLLQRSTTYIGTVKQNKRFLPTVAKSTENRQRGDSKHFYSEDITLCSFWDKGKGPINVFSSMHGAQRNLDAENGKPDIVKFYNKKSLVLMLSIKLFEAIHQSASIADGQCMSFLLLLMFASMLHIACTQLSQMARTHITLSRRNWRMRCAFLSSSADQELLESANQ